jgi:long-chain acyl-CoA synthetase
MPKTLIQIFIDAADRRKPVQFLHHQGGAWHPTRGEDALARVESLAHGLRSLGVQRGDRVAIVSETRLEWTYADLAILGLGSVTVPIYPTLTGAQMAALLKDSGAKVAIVSNASHRDTLRTVRGELPALAAVVTIEPAAGPAAPHEHDWTELVARGGEVRAIEPEWFRASAQQVIPADLATIIYTSGTTGEPKGAMLSHGNIAGNVESSLSIIGLGADDVALSFLPLSHIFERMGGLYAMLAGGVTIAYARSMDTVAADAVEVRPTVLCAVPRFYEKVYARVLDGAAHRPPIARRIFHWGLARGLAAARARFERRQLGPLAALQYRIADRLVFSKIRERVGGRLRMGISGGAPLPARVAEFFFAIGIPILEGYGLTETSPVICLNRLGEEKPGSVGPPIPGVEVLIGAEGEILTRGPHVMQGYFRRPEATAEVIRDGWFHTGDVGHLDADGALHITDRLKDVLVTAGGKKVAPQPIEAKLKDGGWISEAVLLGDRRPYVACLLVPNFVALEAEAGRRGWTTSDRAALLARADVQALFQAEVDRVNGALAPFERIKRFALLDREMTQETGELTPSLKVKRRVVVEKWSEKIEGMYRAADARGAEADEPARAAR